MRVYAVAFDPIEGKASIGGHDWFYSGLNAAEKYGERVIEASKDAAHVVTLVKLIVSEGSPMAARREADITAEVDEMLWEGVSVGATLSVFDPRTVLAPITTAPNGAEGGQG